MAGAWKALVLVVCLSVVSCAPRRRLRYNDIVTRALRIYNDGQRGKPLFRLLEAIPPVLNSTIRIPLNFRIKETVCISPQPQPQECAFRENGEERTCSGEFSRLPVRFLTLTCDRDCGNQPQVSPRCSVGSPEDDLPEAEGTKLPAVVRDLYEKAKYDIISNILSNF
uniref:Cystatin domain-containing protein n=1 Tax=Sciurus vulgaris TaxID=55149 RepID=A0A8D2JQ14_SCIVU